MQILIRAKNKRKTVSRFPTKPAVLPAVYWKSCFQIAVVGGGGKTSLIYRLTDELIDKGKRVIITTTTHMAGESELPFARGGDAVRVKELLDKERYVIAAEYEEDTGKYASLTEEKLEELRDLWKRTEQSIIR